jgi:hypothetical protein
MPQRDNLPHTIDQWTDDGRELVDTLGRVKTFDMAIAAFEAAIAADKHSYIRVSHGARIIRERKAVAWTA